MALDSAPAWISALSKTPMVNVTFQKLAQNASIPVDWRRPVRRENYLKSSAVGCLG
jgi:antitoxin component of RelBE/YafQ-DinJ toxin-antitoxin module